MKIDPKTIAKEDVAGVECRFAVHCEPRFGGVNDFHLIKEVVSLKDGRTFPHVRGRHNYKRPFWITKKAFRNHTQKKEWELESRLQKFESTQSELVRNITRALETPGINGGLRKVCRSPYVYGADILSTATIKREYQQKNPDLITSFTVACSDTETDVIRGTNEIIMQTISFKERVHTAILSRFFDGYADIIPRLQECMQKYLGDLVKERNIQWTIELCDTPMGVIKSCIQKAHEWMPDFLAFWNIDFDIQKIMEGIEKEGGSCAEIFSDPSVPKEFKHFEYKQGPKQKVTASGKVTPIKPAAQWHTVFTPASFYLIDAMCAYRHIRTGQPEEPSYSLDSILKKHLKLGKLKFREADHKVGFEWHQLMQSTYPFEYVIYNVFDCVGMELLDEKIKDLSLSFPMMAGCSDFQNFKSQPRRVVDELHYFVQTANPPQIIGTTSDEMATEQDEETIGLKDWIVMLPAHLVADNGLCVIEEDPTLRTNIRRAVADLDVAASYPNGECVFNISKETTKRELISIENVDELTRRMQGINLSAGATNALEICTDLWKMPTLTMWQQAFDEYQNTLMSTLDVVGEAWDDDKAYQEVAIPPSMTLEDRIGISSKES